MIRLTEIFISTIIIKKINQNTSVLKEFKNYSGRRDIVWPQKPKIFKYVVTPKKINQTITFSENFEF